MGDPEDDWRLTGQERYLKGVKLTFRNYRARSSGWDHDHCEFCWKKFMDDDSPGVLNSGYATLDNYRWICETCFADFQEQFDWTVI